MKKIHNIFIFIGLIALFSSCTDILDKNPKNKITGDQLFSSEEGVRAHLANLYGRLPIEDFNYSPNKGFNVGIDHDVNNAGFMAAQFCDEAIHSEYNDWGEEWFDYWGSGYTLIRNINSFIEVIPTISVLTEDQQKAVLGEAHFLRAYTYFALVKRYGGVSIITVAQEYEGDMEALRVPRSTEKVSWDFIMEECDKAYENLAFLKASEQTDPRKATQWAALALKSRAALHAASIAKYTHSPYITFSGPAADEELVGMPKTAADHFYNICIEASEQLMNSGKFGLYKPSPANASEAAENYRKLFQEPSSFLDGVREPIFVKSYVSGSVMTHNYDIWFRPRQAQSTRHPGRMNPTLDLVDAYEDYTDNGKGVSAPVKTRNDGNETDYRGFDPNVSYIHYPMNEPYKPFDNKDARLHGTVLLPGESWNGIPIIIQGGMVVSSSQYYYRTQAQAKGPDGNTYYTYGAASDNEYSGFDPSLGNYTRSGFLFKKFLQMDKEIEQDFQKSHNDWIEFRYAEILLNYAEAVAEVSISNGAQKAKATQVLNDIRRRAAHTDNIQLTVDNVRKERFVELSFENKRRWDLVRWRTFHTEFENRTRKGLVPFIDLRQNPPVYIFVRVNPLGVESKTFVYSWYYKDIPGIESNGLIQNP